MARGYGSGLLTGLAFSLGAALLGPLWRPLAKGAVKGGLAAYEVGRGRLAEFGEHVQDLVAEAQIERATERLPAAGATAAPMQPPETA